MPLQAVLSGTGVCSLITSALRAATKATAKSPTGSVFVYFGTYTVLLLLTIAAYSFYVVGWRERYHARHAGQQLGAALRHFSWEDDYEYDHETGVEFRVDS